MMKLVHGLGDVVGDLNVAVDDVVLQLQIFECLHQFLDFATHFGCVAVLKLLDSCGDALEVL
jgi:hypothetical protein